MSCGLENSTTRGVDAFLASFEEPAREVKHAPPCKHHVTESSVLGPLGLRKTEDQLLLRAFLLPVLAWGRGEASVISRRFPTLLSHPHGGR